MSGAASDPVIERELADAWTVLNEHGHARAVDTIRARLEVEAGATPTVVVVGEAKRGKSSLINALLGEPGLAPVGADIMTGAYVMYVPARGDVAPGFARIHFSDARHEDVPRVQLAEWITVSGRSSADPRGVAGATVGLTGPGPIDIILVDTPGVSGLISAHGQIALRMARSASALLFVSDAGQDFTAPEAEFLQQAAACVDTVVFALTKIDKYPLSWPGVMEKNRRLLSAYVPRFADATIVGVSSEWAADSLVEHDREVASALWDESRLAVLVGALAERISLRKDQLAHANAVRSTASQLRLVEAQLAERVAAVNNAEVVGELAAAEQAALQDVKRRQQYWGEEFQLAMSRARRALVQELEPRVAALDRDWRDRIARLPDSVLRDQERMLEVCVSLDQMLETTTTELLDSYMANVTSHLVAVLEENTAKLRSLSDQLREVVEASAVRGASAFTLGAVPGQRVGELLVRNSFMGFGAANMVGLLSQYAGFGLAGAVGAASLGPLLLPIAAGATLGLTIMTHKRQSVEVARRHLTEHAVRAVARLRGDVVGRAEAVASELRPEMMQSMREHLAERESQLKQVMQDTRQAVRAAPMERLKKTQVIARQLKTVAAARAGLEAWLECKPAAPPREVTPQAIAPSSTVVPRPARKRSAW